MRSGRYVQNVIMVLVWTLTFVIVTQVIWFVADGVKVWLS